MKYKIIARKYKKHFDNISAYQWRLIIVFDHDHYIVDIFKNENGKYMMDMWFRANEILSKISFFRLNSLRDAFLKVNDNLLLVKSIYEHNVNWILKG